MTKQLSNHAAAAKAIRTELRKHGYKCSVTSDSYAGGSSVDVTITADLSPERRKAITAFCEQFQMGNFNGMTDSYEYSNVKSDLPQVSYVFVRVDHSPELKYEVQAFLEELGIKPDSSDIHRVLSGAEHADFWEGRKSA